MCRELICLVLTLVFCLPSSLQAATIILVSDNKNSGNTDPVTGGPRDQRWIDLLEANGYIVDLSFADAQGRTLDDAKIAVLNAADLIIVSRNTAKAQYDDGDEPTQWNSITTPLIQQSAPFVLSDGDGWRWFDTLNSSTGQLNLEVMDTGHDLFTGLTLGASNQVAIIENQRTYIGNTTDAGNGMVLGRRADNGGCWIVEWKTGVEFYDGSGQFAGGPRMYFPIGRSGDSRDGEYNLTAEGEKVFLNAVRYMVGGAKTVRPNAHSPVPADGTVDVPRDVSLSWTPGEFANTHDVYFGTSFDDVNSANASDLTGIYRARYDANSYTPPDALGLGTTYYWRVDKVDGPPDYTVYRGSVWSFATEPVGYPIENVTATASSSNRADEGPENTINGSGLGDYDLHSSGNADMWLSSAVDPNAVWIQYEFDRIHKLYQMWVWNYNSSVEPIVGFGIKEATIEYSVDGTEYVTLGTIHEFAQAPGTPDYAHNTTVDFGGAAAKFVRLTANSNWGGFFPQYGLSEVRFLYVPIWATEPGPDSGATDVGVDVILSFRAGREAAKHDVYISTDEQTVIDGTADVTTLTETSHGPLSLDLGQTYYWRVDEVNEAETPTTWQGDLWDFGTQEYFVLDDFEDYNDYEPDRIFDAWVDGWGVATNGSTVGYPDPIFVQGEHFVETAIVRGGKQSMPFFYDNNLKYSEAELPLNPPQDWTRNGIGALSLWFYGDPNNTVEQMHVKVHGSKVVYAGDVADMQQASWKQWDIDLASFGVNLRSVAKIAIGFGDETNLTSDGSGVVYFDDIRLYPLREPESDVTGN